MAALVAWSPISVLNDHAGNFCASAADSGVTRWSALSAVALSSGFRTPKKTAFAGRAAPISDWTTVCAYRAYPSGLSKEILPTAYVTSSWYCTR